MYDFKDKLQDFLRFCKTKKNKRNIIFICIFALVIFGFEMRQGLGKGQYYIVDSKDTVVALSRDDAEKASYYPLSVQITKNGKTTKQEILLSVGEKDGNNATSLGEIQSPEDRQNQLFREVLNTLENSQEEKIALPKTLSDGSVLTWSQPGKSGNFSILFLPMLLIFFLYRNERKKTLDKIRDEKQRIRKSLPGFNDQLLLLVSSGLIFNDAFNRIADGYARQKIQGPFENMVCDIQTKSKETNSSLMTLLNKSAAETSESPLIRICGIISDNQYKGVNLSEKLEAESLILWENRKKEAEERGRLAETKLTFPLALLLLVLIVITAAPAIMEI